MASASVQNVTEADFEKEVIQHPGIVVVDFYTDWCPPCKAMAPVLDAIGAERKGSVKIVKVNAEENMELATEHEVQGVPTFVLYRDGKPVSRTSGFQPKARFEQWIESAAK